VLVISSTNELREYTNGVRERAECHAPDVDAIWPCILGYVQVYADQPMPFEVRSSHDGKAPANQAWANFKGRRISFSYRRKPCKRIDVLDGLTVLASFDDNTKPNELLAFFKQL
jgi:hypothetical protein